MPEVILCAHCSIQIGSGKYCSDCKTAAGRKEMDENNKKLFKKVGLEYKCKSCGEK